MKKTEGRRLVNWRMKIVRHAAETTQNVSKTCRYFGISRNTFYKWLSRYETYGEAGLYDRPKRPKNCPHETPKETVSKILYLRQNYHFGPGTIASYLHRYHEVKIAPSSVHRILQRQGLNRLPSSQKHRAHVKRWKRYEKRQPGHRVQVDVKFLERIPGTRKRLYQCTAIDDCTRIRVLNSVSFGDDIATPPLIATSGRTVSMPEE